MQFKRMYPLVLLLAILTFTIAYLYFSQHFAYGQGYAMAQQTLDKSFPVGIIAVGNSSYYVYIANTVQLLQRGYMNESGIGDCRGLGRCAGMLFLFSNESLQCFWMKNTLFQLKQSWIYYGKVSYMYLGTPLSTNVICSRGSMALETLPSFPINYGENITYTGSAGNSS